ncbi:MAG: glycosyltransferase family 2 protein, partial [Sulfitobacter sp.]|nr:glycosyltransferase family 2 protein [Sulfitobacter sp.]
SGALTHGEDAARAAVLSAAPDVSLFSLEARRWNRVELLQRAGFLVGSKCYAAYLKEAGQ